MKEKKLKPKDWRGKKKTKKEYKWDKLEIETEFNSSAAEKSSSYWITV